MADDPYEALLDEIFDDVEELAAELPRRELALTLEQRARELAPGTPGRAAWLSHAGEHWELAGELARARDCYERAAEDGGPAWLDPRAELFGVLVKLGDKDRAEELLDELRRDLAAGRVSGDAHDFVGETLEEQGRLTEALRWFSAGLTRARNQGRDEAQQYGCLNGRYRVRRTLGLPLDRYDALCEEMRHNTRAEFDAADSAPAGPDDPGTTARLALLYWPPDQFTEVLARWPAMGEDCGTEHAEHRSIVERHLRRLADSGVRVSVTRGTVVDYVEFAKRRDRDPAESSTRAGYAAHLALLGHATSWPPGRNQPCWCGSGSKYKKCCGGLRFSPPGEQSDLQP